jgi:hypothetical protein
MRGTIRGQRATSRRCCWNAVRAPTTSSPGRLKESWVGLNAKMARRLLAGRRGAMAATPTSPWGTKAHPAMPPAVNAMHEMVAPSLVPPTNHPELKAHRSAARLVYRCLWRDPAGGLANGHGRGARRGFAALTLDRFRPCPRACVAHPQAAPPRSRREARSFPSYFAFTLRTASRTWYWC